MDAAHVELTLSEAKTALARSEKVDLARIGFWKTVSHGMRTAQRLSARRCGLNSAAGVCTPLYRGDHGQGPQCRGATASADPCRGTSLGLAALSDGVGEVCRLTHGVR